MHKSLNLLATLLATTVLLAACGGGGGGGTDDGGGNGGGDGGGPPSAGGTVPGGATASTEAFAQYLSGLRKDGGEPLRLDGVTLPTSETAEPVPLSR